MARGNATTIPTGTPALPPKRKNSIPPKTAHKSSILSIWSETILLRLSLLNIYEIECRAATTIHRRRKMDVKLASWNGDENSSA